MRDKNLMPNKNSAAEYISLLEQKAPELLDLFCSENNESFETAFDKLLEKAIIGLQQNCKDYSSLNENGLSSVLAQALQMPGLNVQREPSSNGHVDIMITVDHSFPLRIKLIEAKMYDGPAYHIEGLNQLLGRYTTGQETRRTSGTRRRRAFSTMQSPLSSPRAASSCG